jgi:hypothetical protein
MKKMAIISSYNAPISEGISEIPIDYCLEKYCMIKKYIV